jgi:formylglycine-generating enzyme required for sulfatase activity
MSAVDLIAIPSGEFLMGETPGDRFANDTERPCHWVRLPSFHLSRFPITIAEFQAFCPGHCPNQPGNIPVTNVTWTDAVAYCDWLGNQLGLPLRLPTEAEWEYAARSNQNTLYPWGDEISPELANYRYAEDGSRVGPGHPTPAGNYPPNAFGIFDLAGNVAEWTQDSWCADYYDAPHDGSARKPSGTSAPARALRGGAWDYLPRLLRCSWRDSYPETSARDNLGFRIAASLD